MSTDRGLFAPRDDRPRIASPQHIRSSTNPITFTPNHQVNGPMQIDIDTEILETIFTYATTAACLTGS